MPAKRSLTLALALLLVAAIPARATGFPPITVVDTINPGAPSATPLWANGRLGDYLYFPADDGTNGFELWRTNGTATTLVANINTGAGAGSVPYPFGALGDWLYFGADDLVHGRELWRTNGTDTNLVSNIGIDPGGLDPFSANPNEFTVLGDWLYFSADDGVSAGGGVGGHGIELWRTNGTITQMVKDIQLGFRGSSPINLKVFGEYLYFAADDGVHGNELWRTNGTTTEMVRNIAVEAAEPDSSNPMYLTVLGNYLYFSASDVAGGHDNELWRTDGIDGTDAHTHMVKDINTNGGSYPQNLTVFNGYIYFSAVQDELTSGYELWRSDGTAAGTTKFKEINPGSASASPTNFTPLGTHLFFSAGVYEFGQELWWTDGISGADAHTAMIQDINLGNSGADSSSPRGLKAHGDYVYFVAGDGTSPKLWRVSDQGVIESAVLPGTNGFVDCMCSEPIIPLNGRLFMTTYSTETGMEFSYLDEPTWVMPSTNRDGSPWSVTLVVLAAVTAAAGLTVRMRKVKRA